MQPLQIIRGAVDPHAGVHAYTDYTSNLRLSCKAVVVGSGPGGAVVAKELAEAGIDVILLEEGPPFGTKDFRTEAGESMYRTLREGGMRTTRGSLRLPTMQAIALGGGSLVNSAICARSPDFVFENWKWKTGVQGIDCASLEPHYARVEQTLRVAPTPMEVMGDRNLRFKQGCDALGISSSPTHRNVAGCKGSGQCFTGCPNGAKRSTDVSYVPPAIRAGARVYTSMRAERIMMKHGRATGIRGHVIEPFTGRVSHLVDIQADTVVLAAGCMQTPVILLKSGLGSLSEHIGQHLQLHPGLGIAALYDQDIDPCKGATQGYHSLHFLKQGIKLEVLWAPPAIIATRFPGLGHDYQEQLLNLKRIATFNVIVAAHQSSGSVSSARDGWNPVIDFPFNPLDVALLQKGFKILADICWASGATSVLPGLHGIPDVLHSRDEAEILRTKKLRATDMIVAANHAFGTTRMSRLPNDGVVNERGRCHGVDNLYIADTGIFPGSPAVNPMLTCMALADRIAHGIIERR